MEKPETVKLNLRLEGALRDHAGAVAKHMGMSLNSFIVQAVKDQCRYHVDRINRQHRQSMAHQPSTVTAVQEGLVQVKSTVPKVGANQPCPCGSGEKYKRCHGSP